MMKKLRRHWSVRWLAYVLTVTVPAMQLIPAQARVSFHPPRIDWNRGLKAGYHQTNAPRGIVNCQLSIVNCQLRDVRILSPGEMRGIRGKGPYRNKYFNGVLPWQRSLRDVNLCNGNLFKSFTDIQVPPARGAGLVLQRTYNSNDERIGPFGVGWTHAYDIRVEESTTDNVARTDFFGGKHTYHRDADGLYSPPPYLYDELSSDYDTFLLNGPPKVLADTEKWMDGTVKHFFLNGNERACDWIDDRHGNRTNLAYNLTVTIGGVTKNLLTSVTDPSGRGLTFAWTNLGTADQPAWRITQCQGPIYRVTYDYWSDPADTASYQNLKAVHLDTDGLNRVTNYTYASYVGQNGTETGLLSSISDPLSHAVSYQYSLAPQTTNTIWVTQVTEPGSGGNHVCENGNDRVSSVTDPVTGAVGYTYRMSGERLTMSLPGGGTWAYNYDVPTVTIQPKDDPNSACRMLSKITDDQGRIVNYRLDLRGRLHETYFNQVFDGQGALASYCKTEVREDVALGYSHGWTAQVKNIFKWINAQSQWQSRVLTQNDYTNNTAGMRLTNQISDANGPVRTENYGYDELYRLTSVNYGDGGTQSYGFDTMGNRLSKTDNGLTENYGYNNANMLLTRGANNYTNDLDGNTLIGGGRTNNWDSQNRLAQCVYNGNTSVFTYAADGIRHRSNVNNLTTDYVLDASMFVRERRAGANLATYLTGPRGPEYRRDDSAATIRWYCYDGLGSVLAEIDPAGNLTSTRKYDVYGLVRGGDNPGGTSKHKFVGNLGHPSEDETGLIYMGHRYMDPVSGRFVSEDSARHGDNWLAYADDDPVNEVDATGNESELVGVLLAGFLAAGLNMLFQWLLFGDIHWWRVGEAFLMGLLGGAVGKVFQLSVTQAEAAYFGESSLTLGQKVIQWLLGQGAGGGVGAFTGLNHEDRPLKGPLGKLIAGWVGENLILRWLVSLNE